jgi:hypothetical protein
MNLRLIRAGVWLAAIAALALWYVFAWTGQATLDLVLHGLGVVLDAFSGIARWEAVLDETLLTIAAIVDGLVWTFWLLGSAGLLLTAAYAAWLLRRGAWHSRPRQAAVQQARGAPDRIYP